MVTVLPLMDTLSEAHSADEPRSETATAVASQVERESRSVNMRSVDKEETAAEAA